MAGGQTTDQGDVIVVGRRRSLKVVGVFAAVLGTAFVASPDAFAATCSNTYQQHGPPGHYYSAENTSTKAYGGIEGGQAPSSLTLNGARFIINWLGASGGSGCSESANGLGDCSIQAGYGTGTVGEGHESATASGTQYYFEEGDVNGYAVTFTGSPTSWFVTKVYYTGQTNSAGTEGLWDAYISPSTGGHMLMGQAYFPTNTGAQFNELAAAQTEVDYSSSGTCAAISAWNRFGTDSANNISSGTELQDSSTGSTFAPYSGSDVYHFYDSPVQYNSLSGTIAFENRS